MSITIFNGYKVPKFTLTELVDFNSRIKSDILDIVQQLVDEFYAYKYITYVDDICINYLSDLRDLQHKYRYDKLQLLIDSEFIERYTNLKNGINDPEIDFNVSVTYIPIKAKIVALFHTQQMEVMRYWNGLPEVKEYHYQDQTSKPANVRHRQWKKRLSDWSLALNNFQNQPIDVGVNYTFIQNGDIAGNHSYNTILSYQPTFEERLERVVQRVFLDKYFNDLSTFMTIEEKNKNAPKIYNEGMRKYKDQDDKFIVKQINDYKNIYQPKLIQKFTKKQLSNYDQLNF